MSEEIKKSITDEELAQLFIEANYNAVNNSNYKVADILPEEEVVDDSLALVPSEFTKEKISSSLKNKDILHKSLIDTNSNGNYWDSLAYKIKKFFFNQNITFVSTTHLNTPDWSYYQMYKNKDNKTKTMYRNDLFTFTELTLRSTKKLKSIFIQEVWLFLLGIAFFTTILLWLQIINTTTGETLMNNFVNELKNGVFYINIIGISVSTIPYVLIMSMWFMNVNNMHVSKNFHYLTASTTVFSYLIFFVSTIVLIIYHIFDLCFKLGPVVY